MSDKSFTENEVKDIILECRAAGKVAAEVELQRGMKAKGVTSPTYIHPQYGECAHSFDICGYGFPVIDCQQSFYRVASKLSRKNNDERLNMRFTCDKNEGGGGAFSVYDMTTLQDMCVNLAAEEAVRKVLDSHGVKVIRMHEWVD